MKIEWIRLIAGLGTVMWGAWLAACGAGESRMGGTADSSWADVEGYVYPPDIEAKVYLSRGGEIDSTVTRDGWFQLGGIDFGLYVLQAQAEGYSGDRRLVSIERSRMVLGEIHLERNPWPIASISPRDSLVMNRATQASLRIRFSTSMDRASIEKALRMDPPLALAPEWADPEFPYVGDILYLSVEPKAMEPGRVYRLALDTSARTMDGHPVERRLEYPMIRRYSLPGEGATPGLASGEANLLPIDPIGLVFTRSMDQASVAGRIRLSALTPFSLEWNTGSDTLWLRPETRWPPGQNLSVALDEGYRSLSGETGEAISWDRHIRAFGVARIVRAPDLPFENECETHFTMPVDFNSLRYKVETPVKAVVTRLAPDRIHWSFEGTRTGVTTQLLLQSAKSIFGDSLAGTLSYRFTPSEAASSLRFADTAVDGIASYRDTLRLIISRSAFPRLRNSAFALSPDHPVSVRWTLGSGDYHTLSVSPPQPLPSGTEFKLFPVTGAVLGDTLSFRTRNLAGTFLRPFQGEAKVEADQPVEIRWNAWIDTVDFASRVTFLPAVDSLRIIQDTAGGVHLTRIHHAAFSPDREYRVRVGGVSDLFGVPLPDTLAIRFRSRP